jgi:hypothetical protein
MSRFLLTLSIPQAPKNPYHMKSNRTRKHARRIVAFSMGAGLMLAQACFASGLPIKDFGASTGNPGEEKPARKNKTVSRSFSSRNNASVKIYPDALKKEMHVIAKGHEGKEIDFFVFDLQGTLMHNYRMKAKDHRRITGLARGSYVYRVFCGDEETATGNFEIR